jgi:shikimate dehydrogenase
VTDRYAVAGNPVAHSLSPRIHAEFARLTGQDLEYGRLLVPDGAFAVTARRFFDDGGRGLNVTVPCKEDAFRFAGRLSERARRAGAVNTLWLDGDGVHGDNTDGAGLVRDLVEVLGWPVAGRRLLILGAGGAVRGILGPLLAQQPARLIVANRTVDRAQALAAAFADAACAVEACGFDELAGPYDLLLHATSAGLDGRLPTLPAGLAAPDAAAYDLFYADRPTPFLRWAAAAGIERRADGLGMLIEQAAESFLDWRGVRPETDSLRTLLRTPAAE